MYQVSWLAPRLLCVRERSLLLCIRLSEMLMDAPRRPAPARHSRAPGLFIVGRPNERFRVPAAIVPLVDVRNRAKRVPNAFARQEIGTRSVAHRQWR